MVSRLRLATREEGGGRYNGSGGGRARLRNQLSHLLEFPGLLPFFLFFQVGVFHGFASFGVTHDLSFEFPSADDARERGSRAAQLLLHVRACSSAPT